MIPLLFFAIHGQLGFLGPNDNTPLIAKGILQIRSASETAQQQELKVAILAVVLIALATRRREILRKCLSHKLILGLGVLALASTAWSQFPVRTIEFGSILCLNTLFAFYLSSRFEFDEQIQLFTLLGWAVGVGSLLMVWLVPSRGLDFKEGAATWEGIFNQKNDCAIMMCFLVSASSAFGKREAAPAEFALHCPRCTSGPYE